jgi:MerR family transcriptional regulator, light-induced transcriptional regulator
VDPHEHDPPQPRETQITELAGAYADALLAGDEAAAEIVLREAMEVGLSSAEIDEGLIAPAMWLIGELWERGELSAAEEHLATEITVRVLALQREAQRVAQARPRHRVMLATPPGEHHVVALRMVANLLRGVGYDVLMLGADVPAWSIGAAARRHDVDVICLSSTLPGRSTEIIRVIDEIREHRPTVRFVVGGRGLIPEAHLRQEVYVCARVSEAVEAVDAMLQRPTLN